MSRLNRPAFLLTAVVLVLANARADAAGRTFPLGAFNAHFVNVRDFGVRGDGVTDDTPALRRAISACVGRRVTLYLPDGVYRLTGPLEWRHDDGRFDARVGLQGQSEAGTVLRLDDNAPGFQDPARPVAVLKTGDLRGETGGEGYGNNVWDLTVDVGRHNPGARGIFWHANNWSSVRRVTVRAAADSGEVGFYGDCGPASVSQLTVRGFDTGIVAAGAATAWARIDLADQRTRGFAVAAGAIAGVHRLSSDNACPAVADWPTTPARDTALIALVDADLRGGRATSAAVDTEAAVSISRCRVAGYAAAVRQPGVEVPTGDVPAYSTDPPQSLGGTPAATAEVIDAGIGPVPDAPDFNDDDLSHWVSVADYDAFPGDGRDDSAAVQRALDAASSAGKTTVYFPPGAWYDLNRPVTVRGSVRRLAGLGTQLRCQNDAGDSTYRDPARPAAWFVLEHDAGHALLIDHFDMEYNAPALSRGLIPFDHRSAGPVVLRDVYLGLEYLRPYRPNPGCGDLFLDLCFSSGWRFDVPQRVYMWAVNPESPFRRPQIDNRAATLWMVGSKTEYGSTVARTGPSGRTAALAFGTVQVGLEDFPRPVDPAFVVEPGGTFAVSCAFPQAWYNLLHRHACAVEVVANDRVDAGIASRSQQIDFDALLPCAPSGRGIVTAFAAPVSPGDSTTLRTGYAATTADGFNDAPAGALPSTWRAAGGAWAVAAPAGTYWSKQLVQSDADDAAAWREGVTIDDALLRVRVVRLSEAGEVVLDVRSNADSAYRLTLTPDRWLLSRIDHGDLRDLANGTRPWPAGRSVVIRWLLRGDRLVVDLRDQEAAAFAPLASVRDVAGGLPSGGLILRTIKASAGFDDVTVRRLVGR